MKLIRNAALALALAVSTCAPTMPAHATVTQKGFGFEATVTCPTGYVATLEVRQRELAVALVMMAHGLISASTFVALVRLVQDTPETVEAVEQLVEDCLGTPA